jgi:hypothetical protein
MYFFVGFLASPLWTVLFGWIIEQHGFTTGFMLMGLTYLAAMVLLLFMEPPRRAPAAA